MEFIRTSWRNSLKCSKGKAEGTNHRFVKYLLATWCWEHSIDFHTEPVFFDNQRGDFIVEPWRLIIEVLDSEDAKRFNNKKYPYPVIGLPVTIKKAALDAMMNDLNTCQNFEYYQRLYNPKVYPKPQQEL